MKSRNQTGSAHVVIIIVLVVAVLGLLGFVFWQNFTNKAQSDSAEVSDNTSNTTTKTLVISEWGVKGEYTAKADMPISYTIEQAGDPGDTYEYAIIDTPAIPEYCKGYGTIIWRYSATDQPRHYVGGEGQTAAEIYGGEPTDRSNKVGDHYYYSVGPQSVCRFDEDNPHSLDTFPENVANSYVIGVTMELNKSLVAN